ncbi:MAG TPA: RNA polymerase sigma factor [Puia sp.]|nr:RNA polymerase sigma factor [Puia sp.]
MSTIEFNQLLVSQSDRLKPYAINFTKDGEDAKDLLQETIYRALTYREKFNEGTNIQAWLFTIMRNTFINRYRRRVREKKIFQPDPGGFLEYRSPATANLAESRLGSKEIQEALHKLPESCQIPFRLYFEGYQYQEIADIMDIALGTIKSRIHLARKLLKEKIGTGVAADNLAGVRGLEFIKQA